MSHYYILRLSLNIREIASCLYVSNEKFIFIVGCIAIVVVFGLVYLHLTIKTSSTTEDELVGFLVPEVEANGQVYTVTNGNVFSKKEGGSISESTKEEVLRLARFVVETRIDPVFGLAGADTEKIRRAARFLEQDTKDFIVLYPEYPPSFVVHELYPTDLFYAMADMEEARREFVHAPSSDRAGVYEKLLMNSIELYQKYLVHHRNIGQTLEGGEAGIAYFSFTGGATSLSYLNRQLDVVLHEVSKQKTKAEERFFCYEGESTKCASLEDSLSTLLSFTEEHDEQSTISFTTIVPPYVSKYASLFADFIAYQNSESQKQNAESFVLVDDSTCLGRLSGDTPIFATFTRKFSDEEVLALGWSNDLLFYETEPGYASSTYLGILKEHGVPYAFQPATNFYMCPDSAGDYLTVGTLLSIQRDLQGDPLFRETSITGDLFTTLASLEESIAETSLVRESDVASYTRGIGSLIKKYGEEKLAEIFSPQDVFRMEEFIGYYYQNTPLFADLLFTMHDHNQFLYADAHHKPHTTFTDLFVARGYQAATFSLFNRSVVPQRLSLIEAPPFKEGGYLVSYRNAIEQEFKTDDEAHQFMEEMLYKREDALRDSDTY